MDDTASSPIFLPAAPDRFSPLRPLGSAARSWLAEDKLTGGLVWLRRLSPELLADEALVNDLRTAQSRLAAWSNEGFGTIPQEFADPVASGGIVVSLPPGRLFSEWVAETGRLDWNALQPVAESIAKLLEFAGEHGLADGRLTPERVWVCDNGGVIIPEFGFGSGLDSDLRQFREASPVDVAFWSPQVVDGSAPDPADDLYGFGCLLFYGFTGRAPFGGDNIIQQIRYNQPPSPASIAPDVTPGLSVAVARCLEKDPSRRPVTVGDALRGLQTAGKIPGPAKGKPFIIAEYDPAMADTKLPAMAPSGGRQPARQEQAPVQQSVVVASGRQSTMMMITLLISSLAVGVAVILMLLPKQKEDQRQKQLDEVRLKQMELEARMAAQRPLNGSTPAAADDTLKKTLDDIMRSSGASTGPSVDDEAKSAAARRQASEEADKLMQEISRKAAEQSDREQRLIDEKKAAEAKAAAVAEEAAFKPIFDGKSLAGWRGPTNYWSVRDGYITGSVSVDAPKNSNFYLIYNDAVVGDFELRGQFRFRVLRNNMTANSGIVYRGKTNGQSVSPSYQFEVALDTNKVGALYQAGARRGFYMLLGKDLTIAADATQNDIVDTNALSSEAVEGRLSFKREDWNDVVIMAKGGRLEHWLNGHEMLSVEDNNKDRALKNGSIALELFTGPRPGALIQFRDLKLRKLEPAAAAPSSSKR